MRKAKLLIALAATAGLIGFAIALQSKPEETSARVSEHSTGETAQTLPAPARTSLPDEAESAPAPDATSSPQKSPAPPMATSPEEFRKLTAKTQKELPTLAELRKLSEEDVHGTPAIIREAGEKLGQIAQALHDNASLSEDGARFYSSCASRGDLPTSIRALCYSNLKERAHETGVPQEVKDLADRLH